MRKMKKNTGKEEREMGKEMEESKEMEKEKERKNYWIRRKLR